MEHFTVHTGISHGSLQTAVLTCNEEGNFLAGREHKKIINTTNFVFSRVEGKKKFATFWRLSSRALLPSAATHKPVLMAIAPDGSLVDARVNA